MTIAQYFERIIKKQKEIGYYFPTIIRPPATLQQIEKTERKLNLKFNNELLELYLFADGTTLDQVTPCGKTGLIPIHTFLGLKEAEEYYQTGFEQDDLFRNSNTSYRPGNKLFPLLEDGAGNCHWVDLNNTENHGRVYWTNTFGEQPDYLYNSLTSLFKVIDECYQQDIFKLDGDGYLNCDYTKFGQVSQKHNSDIEYWRV